MGVVPPSIVHLVADFVKHLPIVERKAAHHCRKGELLVLRCSHPSWNCAKWQVVTGSRKIISWMKYQALLFLTPQTLYIRMRPQMYSEMNHLILSQSNNRHQFIADVSIFALAVAFPFISGCPLMPSLWVEDESASKAWTLWFRWIWSKDAQSQCKKWCKLLGVFWNERHCFLQVTWCQDGSCCCHCVQYGRKREWRCSRKWC